MTKRYPRPFVVVDDISLARAPAEVSIPGDLRRFGIVAGWVAVVVPFVLEAVTIIRASHFWIVHQLPDDAFYYLEVARRLGKGDGFTFDGAHATNGFHPLWQGLLVPLSRIFSNDDAFAKASLLLGVVLTFIALFLVIRVVQRAAGWGPALSAERSVSTPPAP